MTEEQQDMSIYFHPQFPDEATNYFGFFGKLVNSNTVDAEGEIQIGLHHYVSATKWNLAVAVNLIPVIGNITAGIMHTKMAYDEDGVLEDKRLFARGIAELTVVGGVVFAIGDVAMTLGRMSTRELYIK